MQCEHECTKLFIQYACGIGFWDIRGVLLIYHCLRFLSKMCSSLDIRLSWFLYELDFAWLESYLTPIHIYMHDHTTTIAKQYVNKLILKQIPLWTVIVAITDHVVIPLNYSTQIIYIIRFNNYIFFNIISNRVKLLLFRTQKTAQPTYSKPSQQSNYHFYLHFQLIKDYNDLYI